MSVEREVTLWPSRENFARFAELCDDEVAHSFDEFEAAASAQLAQLAAQDVQVERIAFDPEKMAQWCRAHFGKVGPEGRAAYAAFLALRLIFEPCFSVRFQD